MLSNPKFGIQTSLSPGVSAQLCPDIDWSVSVCNNVPQGERTCKSGELCELLHVFDNPDGEFNTHVEVEGKTGTTAREEVASEERGREDRRRRGDHDLKDDPRNGNDRKERSREDKRRSGKRRRSRSDSRS